MLLAAIGDVHGERGKLANLLPKLPSEAKWVFLGDYVDRGPDSAGTLTDLVELKAERPDTVFLRGNHDQFMLDARDFCSPFLRSPYSLDLISTWFTNGGADTMRSYAGPPPWYQRVPDSHWTFLESTALEYREAPFVFVHAGLLPSGYEWSPEAPWATDPRLWIRSPFLESEEDFGGRVVFGHTPQLEGPLIQPNKIGIDTGAPFGGPLTAALLDTGRPQWVEFVQ